jgi:hypothetical protein
MYCEISAKQETGSSTFAYSQNLHRHWYWPCKPETEKSGALLPRTSYKLLRSTERYTCWLWKTVRMIVRQDRSCIRIHSERILCRSTQSFSLRRDAVQTQLHCHVHIAPNSVQIILPCISVHKRHFKLISLV